MKLVTKMQPKNTCFIVYYVFKYIIGDGKVRAGTLEDQQALIRNTLELDRSEERINQLFD